MIRYTHVSASVTRLPCWPPRPRHALWPRRPFNAWDTLCPLRSRRTNALIDGRHFYQKVDADFRPDDGRQDTPPLRRIAFPCALVAAL
jgi:hypothetical protein